MNYQKKTKEELINELQELQQKHDSLKSLYNKDITEQKQAEDAMRESEERCRILFDESPMPTLLSEIPSERIAYINKRMAGILGKPKNEIIGKTANELGLLKNPGDQSKLTEMIIKKGYVDNVKLDKILPDGTQGSDLIFMRIVSLNGKPYCLTIIQDISEQQQAEEALRKSERRYRSLIETTDTGFVIIDNKGIVIDANQEYVRLSGHATLEEILGKSVIGWTANEEKEANEKAVMECMTKGFVRNLEITYVDKSGNRTPIEINATMIEKEGKQKILTLCRDITGRKKTEEAQKQVYSLLQATLESTADGILVVDQSGKVTSFNKKFGELWHIPQHILDSRDDNTLLSFIFDQLKDADKFISKVQELYSKPYQESFDTIEFKDGRVFERFSKPQQIDDKIIGRVWSFRDITERKIVEDALLQSEEKFSKAFRTSPYAFAIVNMDEGKIIDVNDAFTTLSGYSWEEAIDSSTINLKLWVHEEDRQQMLAVLRKKGTVTRLETQLCAKNGNIFDVLFSALTIRIGIKPCIISIVEDITDRKQAEFLLKLKTDELEIQNKEYLQLNERLNKINEELQFAKVKSDLSLKLLQNITDNIPAFIAVVDATTLKYKFANLKYATSFNKKSDDIIGAHFSEIIGESNSVFAMKYIDKAKHGKTSSYINTFKLEEGERYFNVNYVPVYNSKEEVFEIIVLSFDVTSIKESERELLKAKEKAEESDRLKTAFLHNLSHEIRTPMNAIMGFSGLLIENYNNKPKLEKFSEIINQRCKDLLEIINDILDIAKIESGQLPLNMEECYLHELFSELTSLFSEHQKRIDKQQIKLKLHAFCDSTENAIITDKVKLKQIFINLIDNAFKFTENGIIKAGCRYDGNHNLIFYVSDTGIGIPPDKHNEIFERFIQLEQEKINTYGGTGLGLSIVKGLINLLGGNIWLESEPGIGTTFYFSFPYTIFQSAKPNMVLIEQNQEYNFTGQTILVVEDDIYNMEYIREILHKTKLNILHTEFGQKAISLVTSHSIDLILMDIRLSDINGYEVINQMIQCKPEIKIIAQTAYASHDDRQKAFNAGCVDYISKPLKRDLLLPMIYKHLSKK
jgi:PAS domain S-box-containing protein